MHSRVPSKNCSPKIASSDNSQKRFRPKKPATFGFIEDGKVFPQTSNDNSAHIKCSQLPSEFFLSLSFVFSGTLANFGGFPTPPPPNLLLGWLVRTELLNLFFSSFTFIQGRLFYTCPGTGQTQCKVNSDLVWRQFARKIVLEIFYSVCILYFCAKYLSTYSDLENLVYVANRLYYTTTQLC